MTPEETTKKIVNVACDTLTEIPIYPRILEIVQEAQREAVEKTKQACWEWFRTKDSYFYDVQEEIDDFNAEVSAEKILGGE